MTKVSLQNGFDFSQQYFLLRKKEGRIYSDQEVASLPEIEIEHQYYKEWQIRKESSNKLVKYLTGKHKALEILEVGCGNGWLSAKLSAIPFSQITAIDINSEELNQAKRVFEGIKNIHFFNYSFQDEMLSDRQFDIIVFAASIQYFSSFEKVVNDLLDRLKTNGEIHIIDTHFYRADEIDTARLRSNDYYEAIGFHEMSEQYFHHSIEQIRPYNYDILHDPNSFFNKLKKNYNPFYWICIRNNA